MSRTTLRPPLAVLALALATSLAAAGCFDDARRHGIEYLVREKQTGGGSRAPQTSGLARDVPTVYALLQAHYLYRDRIPASSDGFATVEQLIAALNDPFTFEVSAADLAAFLQGSQDSFGMGVGAVGGHFYVTTIDPGGPAWQAGLRRNDILVRVNQLALTPQTTFAELNAAFTDPVVLEVRRAGVTHVYAFGRAVFTTVSVEEQSIDSDTHYVRIGGWPVASVHPRGPAGELEEALLRNPGKSRWVVDVRWNSGGSLGRAAEVVDLFVASGTVVTLTDHQGNVPFAYVATPGGPGEGRQVVVLQNGGSASASEIVAAALRDLRGAPLVGTHSAGKDVAQTNFMFAQGGALWMVTHQLRVGSGTTWASAGLAPDVVATLDPQRLVDGEDSQLTAALNALGGGVTASAALAAAAATPEPAVELRREGGELLRMR